MVIDIASSIESIKEIADKISETVLDLWENNKPLCFAALGMFLLIIILLFVLAFSTGKKTPDAVPSVNYEISEFILYPDLPQADDGYEFSRKPPEAWGKEETDEWFTVPNGSMLKSLDTANTNLIQNLLEAAP